MSLFSFTSSQLNDPDQAGRVQDNGWPQFTAIFWLKLNENKLPKKSERIFQGCHYYFPSSGLSSLSSKTQVTTNKLTLYGGEGCLSILPNPSVYPYTASKAPSSELNEHWKSLKLKNLDMKNERERLSVKIVPPLIAVEIYYVTFLVFWVYLWKHRN